MKTLPKRSEIPVQYRWSTESIFATVQDWEAALTALDGILERVVSFKGRLAESAEVLADFLDASDLLDRELAKLQIYARLTYAVDTTDQEALGRNDRMRGVSSRAAAAVAFGQPEILAISAETLKKWLAENSRLAEFAHFFERVESYRPHVRSEEVEQVLRMTSDAFDTANSTHSVLANADLKFSPAIDSNGQQYVVAQSTINKLLTSSDRTLRKNAWISYADAHLAYKNTMANTYVAGVKCNVFRARVRGYSSSLQSAMKRDFIPVDVYHNLTRTFTQNIGIWHRYWRVRKKLLGVDTLHEYDLRAPLGKESPVVPYAQAVEWIAEGMRPLGEEYVQVLRRGCLEERWVDVYPNQGKRIGAFASGTQGTRPFIFVSYVDDLYSLSTLAHELGHAMHAYLTRKNQKRILFTQYGLFAAEVASNFNQAMVRHHLFNTLKQPSHQLAVVEEAMSNFYRYFYIMPTLARFELAVHERVEKGQAVTADYLNSLLADLIGEVFGGEVELDRERTGIVWAQFPTHIYSNFYTYKYATGISGAHALARRVLSGESGAVEDYLTFLKAGGSCFPLDALKRAGVDMTSPEPVESTFAVLDELVQRLEAIASA